MRPQGSILVGVLWCLALLSIAVIGLLHTARMDLMVQKNYGDRIQAHYLALAGIERAKALLYQNARDRSRSGKNHTGELYDATDQFRNTELGRGKFRVLRRGREDEGGGILYGVSDEESRLNVNTADTNILGKLEGMTPDILAAIADWRDGDNQVSPGGAEAEYYASAQPPRQPRNGPIPTIRELLMVRGVSPDLLFGRDRHQNGFLGAADEDAPGRSVDPADAGWAALMTVDSSVRNVNAAGDDRINIQSADENALAGVPGISESIAKAIVAYRNQNRFESIADLLDVTASSANSSQGSTNRAQSGQPQGSGSGQKVIDENLLMDIADDLTVDSGQDLAGTVNLNTASQDVLTCLPGLDRELAQAIISYRRSSGYFPNIAALLKVQGMTRDLFKQVAPLVTARSETFRILSEGKINSTGTRQRIQAIVRVNLKDVITLSYREDDL